MTRHKYDFASHGHSDFDLCIEKLNLISSSELIASFKWNSFWSNNVTKIKYNNKNQNCPLGL